MESTEQPAEQYNVQVRKNLRTFHENLDAGRFDAIGSLLAPDYYWNYDGNILITREVGAAALKGFVTSTLNGLRAQDIYNIVDGNRGAVLFRISGRQSGPFDGLIQQNNGRYNVRSAEKFVFTDDAQARSVVTITPIGIMKDQMSGKVTVPAACPDEAIKHSSQTTDEFRQRMRKTMTSLHLNANAGNAAANADLAVDNVEVDENGWISHGREAFVKLASSQSVGLGAFPTKAFHDCDVLADGHFGAVEYIWQGLQQGKYPDSHAEEDAMVRARGILFFEFNQEGLIERAISIYDEGVVKASLSGTTRYLYP